MELNRRDLFKGAAAVAVAAGAVAATAGAEEAAAPVPTTMADFNAFLRGKLRLDCDAIGVKFYEDIADVPDYAVSPKADMGVHMSTCQAFSLARFNGQVTVMTKEDEWCWAPLVGYGQVDCAEGTDAFNTIIQYLSIPDMEQATRFYADQYPRLELGKYAAWVIGPLSKIDYEPDVTMIWGDAFKVNWLCLNAKHLDGKLITPEIDGIDSCIYEVVNTIQKQDYQIAFPDPGEIVRARTKMTDMTFTIPASKLQQFMDCAVTWGDAFGFAFEMQYEYPLDYTRPPFYNEVFGMWGLDTGTDWAMGDTKH